MKNFGQYIEEVRTKAGIKNERQLAMKLGITQGFICAIKLGTIPSDELCVKLANLAGDDPSKIIAQAHILRASKETKPYWDKIIKTLAAASLCYILTLPFFYNSLDIRYIM